jgi:hypothetical protein
MEARMTIDDRGIGDLLEESQDLHSDAMVTTKAAIDDLVDVHHDEIRRGAVRPPDDDVRRSLLGAIPTRGILAAAGLGAAMTALLASPAYADKTMDVQMVQTAASLENLAVATYEVALTLDFIGGTSANPVVKAFVMKTHDQHKDHAQAFNAAATRLGGKAQTAPDPVLLAVVNNAKPTLTAPSPVVELAAELERTAASTYVADVPQFTDKNARSVTASIMGVESQHLATLTAVGALLAAGAPELIALPPDATKLPAAAGNVAFPDAFFKTDKARPATEGAVQ